MDLQVRSVVVTLLRLFQQLGHGVVAQGDDFEFTSAPEQARERVQVVADAALG